jgi:hypothetical protein
MLGYCSLHLVPPNDAPLWSVFGSLCTYTVLLLRTRTPRGAKKKKVKKKMGC